jgi:hypothetical protein
MTGFKTGCLFGWPPLNLLTPTPTVMSDILQNPPTEWENIVDKSVIGKAVIDVLSLESHHLERSLDNSFVVKLSQDLMGSFSRTLSEIHVVPDSPLPASLMHRFSQGEIINNIPRSVQLYVIDGQHRVAAMKHLHQTGYMPNNPEFYQWPIVIHTHGWCLLALTHTGLILYAYFGHSFALRTWMVTQNEIGQHLPTLFVDRIVALSDVPQENRPTFIIKSTRSEKEAAILQYLSNNILWNPVVSIASRPLYRTLIYNTAMHWRSMALMHDVFDPFPIQREMV